MLAASWGTCETAATASSCSWAGMTRTADPTAVASRLTWSVASALEPGCGTTTQARPSKRSPRAAAVPDRSRPAMGCEPT